MKNIKKIFSLFFVFLSSYPAQQLEKPKLSCMAKIGLPTLGDRLAIIQAERNNFLETQEPKHRQGFQEQVIAIHQLSADQRAALLNDYGVPIWQNNFNQISRNLIKDKNCKIGWTFSLTGIITLVCLNAWLAEPRTSHQAYAPHHEYPIMHPRFYQNNPARYGG